MKRRQSLLAGVTAKTPVVTLIKRERRAGRRHCQTARPVQAPCSAVMGRSHVLDEGESETTATLLIFIPTTEAIEGPFAQVWRKIGAIRAEPPVCYIPAGLPDGGGDRARWRPQARARPCLPPAPRRTDR